MPLALFCFKKDLSHKTGRAVIEVFTTGQKICDGIENSGDSDAQLNTLLCADFRTALCLV